MADQLQLRRGTTAQVLAFTGAQGELIIDTDKDTIVVQDGVTAGGFPLATETALVDGTFYFNDNTGGGSAANAYILSQKSNTNVPTQYKDGIQLGFTTANANTGPSTASFVGLGVKSLKYPGGVDPAPGDISGRVTLVYDATNNWLEIQRKAVASIDYLNTAQLDVASSSAVNLTASAPNTRNINITGTTTITGFTVAAGQRYFVRFNAALTLTNSASLVTQTGADIVTVAGDTCSIISTAANVVQVTMYSRVQRLTMGVSQATTSGVSFDFTGIPSWAKKITVMLSGVSTNGTSSLVIRLGVSGGIESTGYLSQLVFASPGAPSVGAPETTGILVGIGASAANIFHGISTIANLSGNQWVAGASIGTSLSTNVGAGFGNKTLAGTLDRIRLTTVNGTDTFDAGSVNIIIEG